MLGNGSDSERLPFVLKKLEQTEAFVIELQDELAELRADLEWAVKHAAQNELGTSRPPSIYYDSGPFTGHWVDYAGTPEDMRRVIRAARKGE